MIKELIAKFNRWIEVYKHDCPMLAKNKQDFVKELEELEVEEAFIVEARKSGTWEFMTVVDSVEEGRTVVLDDKNMCIRRAEIIKGEVVK